MVVDCDSHLMPDKAFNFVDEEIETIKATLAFASQSFRFGKMKFAEAGCSEKIQTSRGMPRNRSDGMTRKDSLICRAKHHGYPHSIQ